MLFATVGFAPNCWTRKQSHSLLLIPLLELFAKLAFLDVGVEREKLGDNQGIGVGKRLQHLINESLFGRLAGKDGNLNKFVDFQVLFAGIL